MKLTYPCSNLLYIMLLVNPNDPYLYMNYLVIHYVTYPSTTYITYPCSNYLYIK